MQRFLDGAASDDVLVLRGRCYEHESVPFKALDGIVDSLSAYRELASASSQVEALMPPDVAALARAFPVMLQVEAVARRPPRGTDAWDPSAQRRAAFSALRALLTTIAERRALVIHIDDLHWADQDSAQLLDDLLTPPAAAAPDAGVRAHGRDRRQAVPAGVAGRHGRRSRQGGRGSSR